MTLRLHLTVEDLLRTRWAPTPAPLLELGLAIAMLQRSDPGVAGWRRTVRHRLPLRARPLLTLVPATGAGPVFLDPPTGGVEEGIDAVLRTPGAVVHDEFRRVFADVPRVAPWVRALDRREAEAWRDLAGVLGAAYEAVLAPDRERILAGHRAELAVRGAITAERGLRAALASIYPGAVWDGAVLGLPSASDRDLHLGGRGLTLQPSPFWTGSPLFCDHPDGSMLLVHPSVVPLPVVDGGTGPDPLSALLGQTRAGILALTRSGPTTTELARELGVSAATASEHARTLRAAGLIHTDRHGQSVHHTISPLGTALLRGHRGP